MLETLYDQPFSSSAQILCKNGIQRKQKWDSLNFENGFEFDHPENPILFFFRSNEFDKITEKSNLTIIWSFFTILDNFQIFAKMRYPLVKFCEKHESDVGDPAQPTTLELCPNFVIKWGPELPEIALAQFWRRIRIWRTRKSPWTSFRPNPTNSIKKIGKRPY